MSVWDRFEAEKFRENEVIATFHGERVRGRYALFQTRDKDWLIFTAWTPEDRATSRCRTASARCSRGAASCRATSR